MRHYVEIRRTPRILVGQFGRIEVPLPQLVPPVLQTLQVNIGTGQLAQVPYTLTNSIARDAGEEHLNRRPVQSLAVATPRTDNSRSISREFFVFWCPVKASPAADDG